MESQRDPDTQNVVSVFWEKAQQAAAQQDAESERAWLEGIVELNRTDVAAWLRLASLIADPRERMQCYARVLEISPGHPEAKVGLRNARRGRPLGSAPG